MVRVIVILAFTFLGIYLAFYDNYLFGGASLVVGFIILFKGAFGKSSTSIGGIPVAGSDNCINSGDYGGGSDCGGGGD